MWRLLNGSKAELSFFLNSYNNSYNPSVGLPIRSQYRILRSLLFNGDADHIWGLPPHLLQAGNHQHFWGKSTFSSPFFSAVLCGSSDFCFAIPPDSVYTGMKCLHVKDNFELLSRKGQRHLITVALLCKQKACVRLGKKQNKNDTERIKSTSFLWTEIDKIQYGQVTR